MNDFGYLGVFLLIALENIFPPIPSEIILTFGGFMTTYSKLNIFDVILAATAGSVAGAIVLYEIGRFFTPERMNRLIKSRWGKILHLKKEDMTRACKWFNRHGILTVFFCRCIPILRSLISIPAGISKMKMGLFLLLTFAGSMIWNSVLVYLGAVAGASWKNIIGYMDVYSLIAIVLLISVFLILCVKYIKKRFLRN